MKSKEPSPALDLERGLPTGPKDVAALRKPAAVMSPAEYLEFLSQFTVSPAALRARPGPRGEPFTL